MRREIAEATKRYPKFADGRINYTNERICYVLNCVVVSGDEVLLTRRSKDVIAYPETINGVSGFIDRTDVSIEDLAKAELTEELQAPLDKMTGLTLSAPFVQVDEAINREWRVYAVLAEFSAPFKPYTNWENKSAKWYTIEQAKELKLMPGFSKTLSVAFALRHK